MAYAERVNLAIDHVVGHLGEPLRLADVARAARLSPFHPYRGDAVAKTTERLITWAERNSLADGQWLGYQWDNPEITSLDDCQYHVAVEAERFVPRGEIGRFRFRR